MKLRNEHPSLFNGKASLSWEVKPSFWTKGRTLHLSGSDGKQLVVLGNFTNAETTIAFPAETGEWTDWKSGKEQTVDKNVKVPANSFVIYTKL